MMKCALGKICETDSINFCISGQSFWNGETSSFALSKHIGVHFLSSDGNASKPVNHNRQPKQPAAIQPAAVDGPDQGLTKALALDCEMVGVNHGGKDSILARA